MKKTRGEGEYDEGGPASERTWKGGKRKNKRVASLMGKKGIPGEGGVATGGTPEEISKGQVKEGGPLGLFLRGVKKKNSKSPSRS